MTIAYVNKNSAVGTSVQLAGVTAGNLIVLCLIWTGAGNATVSDGSSTFSYGNTVDSGGSHYMRLAYCLSSVASGTVTYTGTFPGGASDQGMCVMEYSGSSLALDNSNLGNSGTNNDLLSQGFSTTGTTEVVFGGGIVSTYLRGFSSPKIGGVAADQMVENAPGDYRGGALWSKIATVSNSNVQIHCEQVYYWGADAVSFKEGAAGGLPIPVAMADYRQMRN